MQFINSIQSWVAAHWLLALLTGVYLALQLAYGKRSQIDAWCEKQPRLAGVLKVLRGVLPDPWLVVQGLSLLLKKRLPVAYSTLAEKILQALTASVVAFALFGCGGSIHAQIEKALVFEQQVHTYQQQLLSVADAAIVMLPVAQQADARAKLLDANTKLTAALDAKDATLQAALDASASPLDLDKLIADIVSAVEAVVVVVNSFGADRAQTEYVGKCLIMAQVRATR